MATIFPGNNFVTIGTVIIVIQQQVLFKLMLRKVIKGLADQPTNTLSSPDKAGQDQLSSRS